MGRRLWLLVLSIAVVIVFCVGCISRKTIAQTLSYNLGGEPDTIDPALCKTINGSNVILASFEGLMRLDKDNKAIPGIAQSYRKDSDTKYIFILRDSKWSDGKPVTAMDFEYGWKRVLAPETGAELAYQLFCIKNGEAYNKGRVTAESVGVKAVDKKTLEVTLEHPLSYFLELLVLPPFMPIREDVVKVNSGGWEKNPASYIGNGPFEMAEWRQGEAVEFIKNKDYYDLSRIKLDKLEFKMIDGPNEYLSQWETGNIDVIDAPPFSEIPRLKSENKIMVKPFLGNYFYDFNCNLEPLDDSRVRKALTYAIDRQAIIQKAVKEEMVPASSLIPMGMWDADITKDFRDVGGAYFKVEGQVAEAKRLLEEAGYPEGKDFPILKINCDDSGYHFEIAKLVKDMWRQNLGISVELQVLDTRELNEARKRGEYEISRHGWIADYADPMAFLDIFQSGGINNGPRYSNDIYDKAITKAKAEVDAQKRMNLLHEAENMIMNDMPIMPIFYYSNILMSKPNVKGVVKTPLGFTYFDDAYIEGE